MGEYVPDVSPNAYTCKVPVEVPIYSLSASAHVRFRCGVADGGRMHREQRDTQRVL